MKRIIILAAEFDLRPEIDETVSERLDAFRESVLPNEYGITLYRPLPDELKLLIAGGALTEEGCELPEESQ